MSNSPSDGQGRQSTPEGDNKEKSISSINIDDLINHSDDEVLKKEEDSPNPSSDESTYVCRWDQCGSAYNDMDDYRNHVFGHLTSAPWKCKWKEY